jgi:hypothetical protein
MSLILNAVLKFKPNSNISMISDECFDFILEASKRKLAINRFVRSWEQGFEYLNPDEILLEISNSYIIGEAEKILRDDHTIPFPPHIDRLTNLQGLLEMFIKNSIVNSLDLFMFVDGSREQDFETISCTIKDFAKVMKEKLYQKIDYAYRCTFKK